MMAVSGVFSSWANDAMNSSRRSAISERFAISELRRSHSLSARASCAARSRITRRTESAIMPPPAAELMSSTAA